MIFPDIEYYIEYIAGMRDKAGAPSWFGGSPPIALATYDVSFVTSVSGQTMDGTAMTDRQAALAERLIVKYEKQLRKLGVEQPGHKNYKHGIRTVDRSSSVTLHGDLMFLKFPFNEAMINSVKEFIKYAQGRVFWSKPDKAWCFGVTEYNVSWLVAYAQAAKIHVDAEVQELFDLIIEAEQQPPYAIELRLKDSKFYIENAPESLQEYIEQHIGFDNIYALVDGSGTLGYTVSKEITDAMSVDHNEVFMSLCSAKTIDLSPLKNKYSISEVIEWAMAVDRLPIVVYNPNFLTPDLEEYLKYFEEDEIQIITLKNVANGVAPVDYTKSVVYTNKVLDTWEGRMPLLISYANLMHSTQKKNFMNMAEKIVYYCEPLPKR